MRFSHRLAVGFSPGGRVAARYQFVEQLEVGAGGVDAHRSASALCQPRQMRTGPLGAGFVRAAFGLGDCHRSFGVQ